MKSNQEARDGFSTPNSHLHRTDVSNPIIGITECQIIQWFVQPGARVAQFDKICEVQSDKAAVEVWTMKGMNTAPNADVKGRLLRGSMA
jgi:hypothetical protein